MAEKPKTICRAAHRRMPYSQLGNAMLRDRRLGIDARGTLSFILSHPPDWRFTVEWLAREVGIGRQKAQRIVRELVECGYCRRQQHRDGRGRMSVIEYEFTDEALVNPQIENQPAETQTPQVDFPSPVKPQAVNQPLYKEGQSQRNGSDIVSSVSDCASRTDVAQPRFSSDVLQTIASLGIDPAAIVARYEAKTAGRRIRDPNAYLIRMAHDEAAKLHGATVEQIKGTTSRSVPEKIAASLAAVGAASRPNPGLESLLARSNARFRPKPTDRGGLQ